MAIDGKKWKRGLHPVEMACWFRQLKNRRFDIALDLSRKISGGVDSPRIQRGTQRTGQSPCDARNDMIQCCRIYRTGNLPAVFLLVKLFDAAVDPEVDRFGELLHVGRPVRPFMFFDPQATGMSDCHVLLPPSCPALVLRVFLALEQCFQDILFSYYPDE